MRSDEDLIDCQEGSREIPYFQEGKGEKMSSELSSYQQEELTKEDQNSILMIGGIQIFLPGSPVEVRVCVAEVATTERQLVVTVKKWSRYQRLPKQRKMSILRNGSTFSARKLRRLQHWSLQ
jgi:hypothetical protein